MLKDDIQHGKAVPLSGKLHQHNSAIALHQSNNYFRRMQIENHEGTLVHFLQGKRQRIPGRLAPYLGATADRVASGLFEAPAFAFGNDRIGKGTSLAGPKALKKAAKLEFKVNLTPFIAISIPEKVFEVAMSGSW